jgi:enoyl-CoA hydratase/carnithine racemase
MSAPVAAARSAPVAQPPLLREQADRIAILILNRPEARNALSEAMLAALGEAFAALATDRGVRGVVLAANGPAFSAGHDLKQLGARRTDPDRGRAYFKQVMDACSAVMQMVVHLPQPVIAAVEGIASAAGCQLVASCDLAIASAAARFATPGVNIGLFCSTPMVALSRNVPAKHAMELLLTGDAIPAEEAARIGLINHVVAPGTEREAALALAHRIAAKSRHVVALGKEAFYRQINMDLARAYHYAAEVMVQNMMARDAAEGISAFIDKRAAHWCGGSEVRNVDCGESELRTSEPKPHQDH